MNASRHFFSETRMRVKSRFSHAFLPPARFHALVLPLLDTSSPPSAFSVHPLFSLFCYYICSPSPANLCLSMIHLFSPSSSLFLFLCCFSSFFPHYFTFITFPFCYVESSLRRGDVLRHHSSVANTVGNGVFASARN